MPNPTNLPLPQATGNLYHGALQPHLLIHPHYPLRKMIHWWPGWSDRPPHPRDPSAKVWAFSQALSQLDQSGDRAKLAAAVLARRAGWTAPLLQSGFARRLRLESLTSVVLHLSSPSPLDLGLAVHWTYGLPLLPATSLKGLAAAALKALDEPAAERIFGTHEAAGAVAWLDGLPVKWTVERDVMTPHHGAWYGGSAASPSESENPVPIPFVSIAPGSVFEVILIARGSDAAGAHADLDAAVGSLETGIAERGLGAKTAAGYGVFKIEGADNGPAPAARVAVAQMDPALVSFNAKMVELAAIPPARAAGTIGSFVDWCLKLQAAERQRAAACAIVAKVGERWARDKAKAKEEWQRILALASGDQP